MRAPLLAELEAQGTRVEVTPAGKLRLTGTPITEAQREAIRAHREAVVAELSRRCAVPGCRETAVAERFCRAHAYGRGVRGDGRLVSWDGFLLDDDGRVIIHPPCDGDGCQRCLWTGLVLADDRDVPPASSSAATCLYHHEETAHADSAYKGPLRRQRSRWERLKRRRSRQIEPRSWRSRPDAWTFGHPNLPLSAGNARAPRLEPGPAHPARRRGY